VSSSAFIALRISKRLNSFPRLTTSVLAKPKVYPGKVVGIKVKKKLSRKAKPKTKKTQFNLFAPEAKRVFLVGKREKGDGKRWKGKEFFIYFFLLLSFSFFPHATLVMFQTLKKT
jgi:hypothetical protein